MGVARAKRVATSAGGGGVSVSANMVAVNLLVYRKWGDARTIDSRVDARVGLIACVRGVRSGGVTASGVAGGGVVLVLVEDLFNLGLDLLHCC
jgi:hypothetical protein